MRNGTIRRRILLIGSLLLAVLLSVAVLQPLTIPSFEDEMRIHRFHNEPENSLDVVIIGSSDVYTGFSSALAYRDFGIRSYPYAISGETCLMWKAMVKDILRTQSPDVILIETYGAGYTDKHLRKTEAETYKFLDTIPFSKDKLDMALEMSGKVEKSDTLSFMVPFFKYHGRYGSIYTNLRDGVIPQRRSASPLKGIHNKTARFDTEKLTDLSEVDDVKKLGKESDRAVRDFMDYCKTIDTKIVFVKFPTLAKEKGSFMYNKHLKSNMVGRIAEENGFDFISLQKYSHEMGLDGAGDFYDFGHANIYGQQKITRALCGILAEKYGIPSGKREMSEQNRKDWEYSAQLYGAYYELSDREIKKGVREELADDKMTLERVIKEWEGSSK